MKKFWLDCFAATVFVFCMMIGIREVSDLQILNAFDPLSQSLGDMEMTDITFSKMREDPPIDTNIVIVNIGYLSRAEIGQQIRVLSHFKPRVIGIDGFFDCAGRSRDSINCPKAYDTLNNMILGSAIEDAGNVVIVTKLLQTKQLIKKYGDVAMFDSLRQSDEVFRQGAWEGFASLETDAENQEDLKSCRRVNPQMKVRDKTEYAFSVKMAMLFDSIKTKKFLDRKKDSEVINYRGNIYDPFNASEYPGRYYTLDWDQALDSTSFVPGLLKDKVIIMGFLGSDLNDTSWDDKFFTPLNKKFAGKTRPDMYGVVVHANIVSMILNEDYVDELKEWQQVLIAFIACFLTMALFFVIETRLPLWFDGLSLLVQLVEIVICTVLMIYIFKWFNFKLNLTYTLLALALAGTCFELYYGLIKQGTKTIKNKWFTRGTNKVLTVEKP
jgi:CHASE2 domain-containing sensor protein